MVPPVCPGCGVALAALKSPRLRAAWADFEGERWRWTSDHLAYWSLCVDCHKAAWPLDRRCNNAYSRPFSAVKAPRLTEFYLTTPPPEYLRTALASSFSSSSASSASASASSASASSSSASSASASSSASSASASSAFASASSASSSSFSSAAPLQSHCRGRSRSPRRHGERRVAFTGGVEELAAEVVDRLPVAFGSSSCDACGVDLGGRCLSPAQVRLVEPLHSGHRHSALVCQACGQSLLRGEQVYLPSLEAVAEQYWRQDTRSCQQVLQDSGQPYTPKK